MIHYEHLREDPISQVRKILRFLDIEEDPERLKCLSKFKNGFFQRKSKPKLSDVPFSSGLRAAIDNIIINLNKVLVKRGYPQLPTETYNYYDQTDQEILNSLKQINSAQQIQRNDEANSENSITGTKMLLEQYVRWISKDLEDGLDTELLLSKINDLAEVKKSDTYHMQRSHCRRRTRVFPDFSTPWLTCGQALTEDSSRIRYLR